MKNKKILLIICGGISAYKSLEVIRGLKKKDVSIKTILTKSGKNFVTPLSIHHFRMKKYMKTYSVQKMKPKWTIFHFLDAVSYTHLTLPTTTPV